MIYSTKFDSLSNPNAVLRLTHDPTNNPNAALRSTHDLCQNSNQCSWNQYTIPRRTWDALIPLAVRILATTNEKPQSTERYSREVPKR